MYFFQSNCEFVFGGKVSLLHWLVHLFVVLRRVQQPGSYCDSGKDGKPDSWFLFDLYKRKQNPVTKVQEPVPENVTYFISSIQNIAQKRLNIFIC